MTGIEQQREWLALLEAERARRVARTEWAAGEGERQREAVVAELQEMARRMAATAHLWPLDLDNMSIAEKVACRYFLPEDLRPPGLGTEAAIWAEYEARAAGRGTGYGTEEPLDPG